MAKKTAEQLEQLNKNGMATRFKKGEKQAKIGRAGGIASGEAKRAKKDLSQLASMVAVAPTQGKFRQQLESIGITDPEDQTGAALVVAGIYRNAVQGKITAVEKWEQWTTEKQEQTTDELLDKIRGVAYARFYHLISPSFSAVSGAVFMHRYTHFDFAGGRGSTKSSFVSLIVPLLLITYNNVHGLILRKVGNTIRDSVFSQYLWALDQLGIAEYFEARKQPAELTFKPTGQKLLFRGADDPLKIKSIKVEFGYIGITHFEEKDQFVGREEIRNILQSTMRGGEVFWNFESYNPPISRDNWANKDSLIERSDRLCHKSTYLEVPPEWLGQQFLTEAEHLKAIDERAYQHEYLGIPVGVGGNVFEKLELREITDEEIASFDRIYQGVDWGWMPDPFAFVRLYYDRARETIYFIDEHYVNKQTNVVNARWIKEKGYDDAFITCDSAEPKSVADFRAEGLPAQKAKKGAGSVDYGMKWLQGRTIVIDSNRTPHVCEEFTEYEYERDKEGNWISGYPDAKNHTIDATRYALERVYNKYGEKA